MFAENISSLSDSLLSESGKFVLRTDENVAKTADSLEAISASVRKRHDAFVKQLSAQCEQIVNSLSAHNEKVSQWATEVTNSLQAISTEVAGNSKSLSSAFLSSQQAIDDIVKTTVRSFVFLQNCDF
jgi:ABC-type transporter Mla subunit MlaD